MVTEVATRSYELFDRFLQPRDCLKQFPKLMGRAAWAVDGQLRDEQTALHRGLFFATQESTEVLLEVVDGLQGSNSISVEKLVEVCTGLKIRPSELLAQIAL